MFANHRRHVGTHSQVHDNAVPGRLLSRLLIQPLFKTITKRGKVCQLQLHLQNQVAACTYNTSMLGYSEVRVLGFPAHVHFSVWNELLDE